MEELNIAFLKFKRICDSLATDPTEEKLIELREIIHLVPLHLLQMLHEFVLFSFYINLLKPEIRTDKKLSTLLFETLQCILEKVRLEKLLTFSNLQMALMSHIYNIKSNTIVQDEEESKLTKVQCLLAIFKNVSMDVRLELYSKEHGIQLAQTCRALLHLAKEEKLRILRIKSIECLMAVSYIHDEANFSSKELRYNVANVIMNYLPGIAIGLAKIANGDTKQGHKITALSIKALNRLIVLHMQNDESVQNEPIVFKYPFIKNEECTTNIDTKSEKKMSIEELLENFKIQTRDEKWYKETGKNLKLIIELMIPLQHHDHQAVREEMARFCQNILMHCSIHMSTSLGYCIDILIALSEDDDPQVSQISQTALNQILDMPSKNTTSTPMEIIEENFYTLLTKLPRIMNETDISKKINSLNLLMGYIRLLGPKYLYTIFQSSVHLQKLVLCLLHVAQLERSNISLFEEHTVKDFEVVSQTSITWKQFTYLNEKELLIKFQMILKLISKSEAADILIDQLCDMLSNKQDNRKETTYLLNEILSVKIEDMETRTNIVRRVFDMYIEEENWYLPLSVTKSKSDESEDEVPETITPNVSLADVHDNIIQTCLLVEGLGNMAVALEDKFKPFLMQAIYIVLERAGNAQPLISAAGFLALLNISKACGYPSVTNLIVENADYFSFQVIRRLKKLEKNPAVLDVLSVVMNYSTDIVLPSVMNIINTVLLQSCDKFQENNSTAFLKVFLSFIQNLKRWIKGEEKTSNRLVKLLIEYKKTMDALYALYDPSLPDISEEINSENLTEQDFKYEENDIVEENSNKKIELPEHIKLTVNILKRSLNFLPSIDRQRKLLVLDILKSGVIIISNYENELLPIVHQIWDPLVNRFKEYSDPLVINRSFELLIILADTSKDFIRMRTSKNVFPEICSNLKKLSKESLLKDRGSAYRYTQAYKLQINILKYLSELISNLEMTIKDVEIALEAVLPYLSNKQPVPLQEFAVSFYKNVALYDFDSVWLFLINEYGVKKVREDQIKRKDNEKNVETILKVLDLIKW